MSDSKKQADLPLSQVTVAELSDASVTPTTTELDKNAFNNLSAFGFSFAVLNTWVVLVVGLGSSLISGGPSAGTLRTRKLSLIPAFWGFIYAFLCNLAITMSHSEILAVFPTAGGQWHWVAMLSPENWRASLSWTTGVMNVVALWLGQSTVGYLSSTSMRPGAAAERSVSDHLCDTCQRPCMGADTRATVRDFCRCHRDRSTRHATTRCPGEPLARLGLDDPVDPHLPCARDYSVRHGIPQGFRGESR
jgi:hypothetical protein